LPPPLPPPPPPPSALAGPRRFPARSTRFAGSLGEDALAADAASAAFWLDARARDPVAAAYAHAQSLSPAQLDAGPARLRMSRRERIAAFGTSDEEGGGREVAAPGPGEGAAGGGGVGGGVIDALMSDSESEGGCAAAGGEFAMDEAFGLEGGALAHAPDELEFGDEEPADEDADLFGLEFNEEDKEEEEEKPAAVGHCGINRGRASEMLSLRKL